jgi:cytochrome c oxidase subunit II
MMQWLVASAAAADTAALPLAYPGDAWDQMFLIWISLAVGIFLLVSLPMGWFLLRYRFQKGINEVGADEHASSRLEVLWTVVPLMIVIYLAVQSATLYARQRTAPPDAMVVKTQAQMWSWQFTYPNGKTVYSELRVPVGKPVELELTSLDVIHAFHIPEAKTMEDAVPGRVNHMWFQFNKTGDYRAFCREFCGTAHAYMLATIKVVPQAEFDQWLATP